MTDYAKLFRTGQYGRLYIVSGSHARGRTFHIYVLPDGESAIERGPDNGPRNPDAVEVYGVVGGLPGWTEYYGWLHRGPREADFQALVDAARARQEEEALALERAKQQRRDERAAREAALLSTYRPGGPQR